jgi:hypothetical protein
MSDQGDIRRDLDPDLPTDEAGALGDLGQRLAHQRPVPRAGFRGELWRALLGGTAPVVPERLRWRIATYAGSGAALLAFAAAGLAGLGPFAA